MHVSLNDLPIMFGDESVGLRGIDWGGQRVAVTTMPAGGDYTQDICPLPHWGYIIKGRAKIRYEDSTEETLKTGDVFYLPPGHVPIVEEDLEFFEVADPEKVDQVIEAFNRNAEPAGD
jgi:mannose-6-phosphate isomerase-like protein (cupin superfamily)